MIDVIREYEVFVDVLVAAGVATATPDALSRGQLLYVMWRLINSYHVLRS